MSSSAPLPALTTLDAVALTVGAAPSDAQALGFTVFTTGDVPAELGLDRAALERAGFTGKAGSSLVLPQAEGPELVAVGAGEEGELDAAALRDLAATFARAAARHARIALIVSALGSADAATAAGVLSEGTLLARYTYTALKTEPKAIALEAATFSVPGAADADAAIAAAVGAARVCARTAVIARDLANTPPSHLTATKMGEIAVELGERFGFGVEVFDKAALTELGCGGLLGVNQGSAEEPRMIKLTYQPEGTSTGHLGLVGKGIMYDSGGISLKPSDPMHLLMKMDMGGAAAVLGAFTGLREAGAAASVTGWLMCTDNMPSGTAYKLGDVLTARDGTTVEVKNTDAEGRIVMMDAIALAVEEGVDAIIDIATLTGAALMALGQLTAPVLGNDQRVVDLTLAASAVTGEPLWQLPLERKYRPQLDSDVADLANIGGRYAGATTAALFLDHFTRKTPWAHLDIAGTMAVDADESWRSKGATGFGARLLLETALTFTKA